MVKNNINTALTIFLVAFAVLLIAGLSFGVAAIPTASAIGSGGSSDHGGGGGGFSEDANFHSGGGGGGGGFGSGDLHCGSGGGFGFRGHSGEGGNCPPPIDPET